MATADRRVTARPIVVKRMILSRPCFSEHGNNFIYLYLIPCHRSTIMQRQLFSNFIKNVFFPFILPFSASYILQPPHASQ